MADIIPNVNDHERKTCGIVMPISATDGLDEKHWAEVQRILGEAIEDASFIPRLVSTAAEVTTIQKSIVQNLYTDPIVVCDVSARNPNVMFELGMRLTFDKPTVIVKDDKTPYSFDTSVIEHVPYPRDLRYAAMVDFKERLTQKIRDTHSASQENPNFSPFLKHFGTFTVPKLDVHEVDKDQYVLEELRALREQVSALAGARDAIPGVWPLLGGVRRPSRYASKKSPGRS